MITNVSELVEQIVEFADAYPDAQEAPVAVHNVGTGLSHPITGMSKLEDGLLLYVSNAFAEVDPEFRTAPDAYHVVHQINQLFKQLQVELEKPNYTDLEWELVSDRLRLKSKNAR